MKAVHFLIFLFLTSMAVFADQTVFKACLEPALGNSISCEEVENWNLGISQALRECKLDAYNANKSDITNLARIMNELAQIEDAVVTDIISAKYQAECGQEGGVSYQEGRLIFE